MSNKLKALAQEAYHALQLNLRYIESALDSAKVNGADEFLRMTLENDLTDHKELIADLEKALAEPTEDPDAKQPDALRLADAIDPLTRDKLDNLTCTVAATKLRSLHAENARLTAALCELGAQKPVAWLLDGTLVIETAYQEYHEGAEWTPLFDRALPASMPLTELQIWEWWASENGMEDCDMCRFADFKRVVRTVEKKVGVCATL